MTQPINTITLQVDRQYEDMKLVNFLLVNKPEHFRTHSTFPRLEFHTRTHGFAADPRGRSLGTLVCPEASHPGCSPMTRDQLNTSRDIRHGKGPHGKKMYHIRNCYQTALYEILIAKLKIFSDLFLTLTSFNRPRKYRLQRPFSHFEIFANDKFTMQCRTYKSASKILPPLRSNRKFLHASPKHF